MRMLTWKQLKELGLVVYSRQHWDRKEKAGEVPKRRVIAWRVVRGTKQRIPSRVAWVEEEIVAWQRSWL